MIFAYYYFILNKYIEYEMNVDDIGKLLNAYDASHRSTKPEKQLWHNFFKFQTLKKRNINLQIYQTDELGRQIDYGRMIKYAWAG